MAFGHAKVEVDRDKDGDVSEVKVVGRNEPNDPGVTTYRTDVAKGSQEDLKHALETATQEAIDASRW